MNEEKLVTVSLRDLCEISVAVAGLMHDLDNDGLDHPYTDIEPIHAIVEEWAADESVLAGGCHPDHRCRLCQEFSVLGYWSRRHQWAEDRETPGRHPGAELTPGLSSRLEMGATSIYDRWGDEFVLEHVSEAVVRVTYCEETGYFGLRTESHTLDLPYTLTGDDHEVGPSGIAGLHAFHSFATPQAALDSTCAMLLDASGVVDTRRSYTLPKEPLPRPGGLEDTRVSNKTKVAVRLSDLCVIADSMSTMQHDLDNGKLKNLDLEIARLHTIVENWARDENVLGAASCHDDHRCRSCRDFPVLSGLQAARRLPQIPWSPLPSVPAASRDVEQAEAPDDPTTPAEDTAVVEPVGKRHYVHEGEVFILESLSDSVVRVTHREQTGYFGFNRNWEPSRPYATSNSDYNVKGNGIDGAVIFSYASPDAALKALCESMLRVQRREDARQINPEERKRAARRVLGEFMDEIPVPGSRYPPEVTRRMGKEIYERDILHLVEPDHDGEIVAIDVDSGRWAMAEDEMIVVDRLKEIEPGAVNIWCERVGFLALRSLRGGMRRRPRG